MKQSKKDIRTGDLHLHRDGYGFVGFGKTDEEDVFIPSRFVGDAMHTDVVEVHVIPGRGDKKEGRIVRVIEHRVKKLFGRLEKSGGMHQVIVDDKRVRRKIFVPNDCLNGAKSGNNVVIEITRYASHDSHIMGKVVKILGERGTDVTEKEAVITRHHLKKEFSKATQKEAEAAFSLMNNDDLSGRKDLTGIPFVTIDGEDAKDFDDAVAVQKVAGDCIRLFVSIADVSFFVRPGSAIDKEAYERATSTYFPGECIPMLPEQLSNNLCSLVPHENRFTMTAEMDVNPKGEVVRKKFYRSVINSRERMTYTSVKKILADRDPSVRERYQKLLPDFELMEECYKRLSEMRHCRGSLDFDLPEPLIVIDIQGGVSDILRAERHVGHMMIEDFMIAANEAVASYLTEKKFFCIYRIHEPPPRDKLQEFFVLLHNLGYKVKMKSEITPGALGRIIDMVHGRPEERLVNHMLLRSLSQAVYSEKNIGHFGLASKCYCHFTSPIRRYPDLVVHRFLSAHFSHSNSKMRGVSRSLKETADHASRRERVSMEAEREMAKVYTAFFMQEHVDGEFDGLISHITKFGFFVELTDFFVEGLVRIDSLSDDDYSFEMGGQLIRGRKKKKTFRIGDSVRIRVAEVNIPDREILFDLI